MQDRLGQLLFIGLEGPELDAPARDLLTMIRPGGVILFRRNLQAPEQIAGLSRALRRLLSPPPVIAVDQEGGRVSRLTPPFPELPSAWRLGRLPMLAAVRWFGALTGRGLRCLGLQLDFAPVVDLSRSEWGDGIGDRAFADDPQRVTACARAFLEGLAEAGVSGCLKHFPGLGGAPADTHDTLPTMTTSQANQTRALEPYRQLREETPMVMVAHAHYPELSGPQPVPASLDPRIVTDLLRREIGFRGLVVSDDLEMGAIPGQQFPDIVLQAVSAGHDQLLICQQADKIVAAWEGLRRALKSRELDARRLQASLTRIAQFKDSPPCSRPEEPFDPEELAVVQDEMRDLTAEVQRALRRQGA